MIQNHTSIYSPYPGVQVYPDIRAEQIKHKMQSREDDVADSVACLEDISTILLEHVRDHILVSEPATAIIPIYVMRGGMIMRAAYKHVFGDSISGLVIPHRLKLINRLHVVYGNIPIVNGNKVYFLLDIVIATGSTMLTCLESITNNFKAAVTREIRMMLISPFATTAGILAIRDRFPDVQIHTIWFNEETNVNTGMTGINFDAGDYAFGGASGQRIQWEAH